MRIVPQIGVALEELRALDALVRGLGSETLVEHVQAVRRTLLAMEQERADLLESLAATEAKVKGLRRVVLENQHRHTESLRAFDRFRQAHVLVESMRDLAALPDTLDRLAGLFQVDLFRLVLDEEAFGEHAPPGVPLIGQDRLAAMAKILCGEDRACQVGPIQAVPAELFGPEGYGPLRSAFAYPLADRFRPGRWTGIVLAADSRTGRYRTELATDYLEHFCDSLCHVVVDVNDRHKAEALREDVERITRHDLKSPLTAILSLPQFLLEAPNLDERQREIVRLVMDSGRRMLDMINRSLSLYRMEQGVYELAPERVDLRAVVDQVWEEVGAPYRGAGYLFRVEPQAGPFPAKGEELLLHTLLANLLKNALEASGPGREVGVTLSREPGYAVIAVRNDTDVPESLRDTFFDKFTTAGKTGGTGLGTYSARLIAETHGGSIGLETGQGRGTTVTVRLPDEES